MPFITVQDQHYALSPGQTRLGGGPAADIQLTDDALGILAMIDLGADGRAVIRRGSTDSAVRVNGVALGVEPTPLLHGDKVELAGHDLFFADDTKDGATQYVSAQDIAAIAQKRSGAARPTAGTGGRLVSLVDGKEYPIPGTGATIGRDAGATVVVGEREVSRIHAEILPSADGYVIHDRSTNGLYVNGTRVAGSQVLARADVIRAGTEEFRFYADAAAPPARISTAPAPTGSPAPARPSETAKPKPSTSESRAVLATIEIIAEGPTKGTTFDIRTPLTHVGRGNHNDIVLPSESVSDTHAKIQRRDDGWYVVDTGSTNGTYVGGTRIVGERRLEGAPDLRFGGIKTIFRAQDRGPIEATGTRAIAPVRTDRLSTQRGSVASPPPAAASPPALPAPTDQKAAVPVWVWIVVAIAVVIVVVALSRRS